MRKIIVEAWVSPNRNVVYFSSYAETEIPESLDLNDVWAEAVDPDSLDGILANCFVQGDKGLFFISVEVFDFDQSLIYHELHKSKCRDFGHLKRIWKQLRCETSD